MLGRFLRSQPTLWLLGSSLWGLGSMFTAASLYISLKDVLGASISILITVVLLGGLIFVSSLILGPDRLSKIIVVILSMLGGLILSVVWFCWFPTTGEITVWIGIILMATGSIFALIAISGDFASQLERMFQP